LCGSERGGDFDGVSGAVEDLDEGSGAGDGGADRFAVLEDGDGDWFEEGGAALGVEGEEVGEEAE
jgi:hypothetical protein